MTEHIQINDVAPRIHYVADGVQSAFSYPFAIFKAADLEVWLDDQPLAGGLSVSGAGISTGGAVLLAVPPAAGTRVTLRRRLALERISDYQADGIIRAKTLNDELDYQVAALQQVAEDVGRAVKRASTSGSLADLTLPEPAGGRAIKWNGGGTMLVNSLHDPDDVVNLAQAHRIAAEAAHASAGAAQAAAESAEASAGTARAGAEAAAAVALDAKASAQAAATSIGNPLSAPANLSDLPDKAAARANLGLVFGTGAGQVPLAEQVMLRGRHSIWVPAAAMVKQAGNASLDEFDPGGNGYSRYKGWSLDAAVAEGACFDLDMPKGWNNADLEIELLWSVAGTQAGNVRWGAYVGKMAAGGAIPTAWLPEGTILTAAAATGIAHSLVRTALPAVVLSGVADSDTLHLAVVRMAADAADTLAVDAVLRGVKIRYVTSQGSDD